MKKNAAFAHMIEPPADWRAEDNRHADLTPAEAKAFLRVVKHSGEFRHTRLSFFLFAGIDLIVSRDGNTARVYDTDQSVRINRKSANKLLDRLAEFNKIKADHGQSTGKIRVSRCGNCVFLNG